jgi:hypothetical protein
MVDVTARAGRGWPTIHVDATNIAIVSRRQIDHIDAGW